MIISEMKLPDKWKIRKLGELGDFKNGINKDSNSFGKGYPFVNLMDVFGKSVIQKSTVKVGLIDSSENEREAYNLKKGDVLFVRSSMKPEGVGLTILIDEDLEDTVYSGFLIRFRSNDQLVHEFKRHCFLNDGFRRRLIQHSTISANTNINQESLKRLWLIIPSTDEQERIATILTIWDSAIEKTEKLIAEKKKETAALMQQLLTGKRRFKGFEGQKWQKIELNKFLMPVSRPVPKPDIAYKALGLRSHGKGTFIRAVEEPNKVMMDTLYEVRKDDLIVNITFAWEGAIAIVSKSDEGALVSHRFPTYVFNRDLVIPEYLKHLILTKRFVYQLGLVSPGGAGRNRVLNKTDFLELVETIPSVAEQERIAAVLNAADKEIKLLEKELESLERQKQGLMQKLLTGKIRVSV